MKLLYFFLLILSIVGLLLVVFGFQNQSQLSILFGGIAFLAPIFFFIGLNIILPLVPPIALAISFLGKKKARST